VFIDGGNEFAVPGTEQDRHAAAISQLAKAYGMLGYDVFLLSPSDVEVLQRTQINPAASWKSPQNGPELVTKDVPGGRLAFVLFPDKGVADPSEERALVEYAESLRSSGQYNVIIGVSTWGSDRESEFITKHAPVFDIILGSGSGPGYTGLYMRDNQVLWLRAFTKGKTMQTITLLDLPAPGTKAVWDPEKTVITQALPLGDSVQSDPAVNALFQ